MLVNLNDQYDSDIPCYMVLNQLQKVLHIILHIDGFVNIHEELTCNSMIAINNLHTPSKNEHDAAFVKAKCNLIGCATLDNGQEDIGEVVVVQMSPAAIFC